MKTRGSVQGKIIIESPAMYEIINHEGYDNFCPALIAVSFVIAKIPPTKIKEKRKNRTTTKYFFVTIISDIF